jgi:hypothetical protein
VQGWLCLFVAGYRAHARLMRQNFVRSRRPAVPGECLRWLATIFHLPVRASRSNPRSVVSNMRTAVALGGWHVAQHHPPEWLHHRCPRHRPQKQPRPGIAPTPVQRVGRIFAARNRPATIAACLLSNRARSGVPGSDSGRGTSLASPSSSRAQASNGSSPIGRLVRVGQG